MDESVNSRLSDTCFYSLFWKKSEEKKRIRKHLCYQVQLLACTGVQIRASLTDGYQILLQYTVFSERECIMSLVISFILKNFSLFFLIFNCNLSSSNLNLLFKVLYPGIIENRSWTSVSFFHILSAVFYLKYLCSRLQFLHSLLTAF